MKHDFYYKFARSWNSGDFSSFSKKIKRDCTYTSYDYFYKLKGKDRILDFLVNEANKNMAKDEEEKVNVHKGFYQNTNSMLKSIKECCIMVRQSDLQNIRILEFKKRFGKISSITGIDPGEVKSIRDIKL